MAISKSSLGKKVNAKKMISRKKVFSTKKFFPLVYLVNHVEIMYAILLFCLKIFREINLHSTIHSNTVKSLFVTAAAIEIDEFLAQNLLSKNHILLRLLFKGGYYLKVATNKDFTVCI